MDWVMWVFWKLIVFSFFALVVWKVVRFIQIHEASAVVFKYMGGFAYCAMQFSDYGFDEKGFIKPNSALSYGSQEYGRCWCVWRIRGWVVYLWPFAQLAVPSGKKASHITLGNIAPKPFLVKAETTHPENVPLNVTFVSMIRVSNPYLYRFVAPENSLSQAVERIEAILRGWVKSSDRNHAQEARGNGEKLWHDLAEMGCLSVFTEIREKWGIEVLEKSIIVKDVDYDADYQRALKARNQAELTANADVEATSRRVLKAVADHTGHNVEELQEKLKNDPTLRGKPASQSGFKEAFEFAEDLVRRDRAGVNGDLRDIRIGSTDGGKLDGGIGSLAALAAIFGQGGGQQTNRRRRSSDDAILQQDPSELSPENLKKYEEALRRRARRRERGWTTQEDEEELLRRQEEEELAEVDRIMGIEPPTEEAAQKFADQNNGQYPRWDPLKRKPLYYG